MKVCGTSLCLNGQTWVLHGASTNGATPDANARMDMAKQGHLNTVRLTDWIHGDAYDENQWKKVDAMIAAAKARNLHILVDLSTYVGIAKQLNGGNPFTYDSGPFLKFVLTRVNTVSGIKYADDPTIALFALHGEVPPLNTPDNTLGITTQQVNDYFKRTAAEFKALDKNHLLEPGGLYQMWQGSGVDYKTIFSIPDIDVCAVHAPAPKPGEGNDAKNTSDHCLSIGKPWIWEEFSQPQGIGDQNRADFFQTVYDKAKEWKAAGASFWNLGPGNSGPDDSDVGPQTPLTWAVVMKNAPAQTQEPTMTVNPTGITPTFACVGSCCGEGCLLSLTPAVTAIPTTIVTPTSLPTVIPTLIPSPSPATISLIPTSPPSLSSFPVSNIPVSAFPSLPPLPSGSHQNDLLSLITKLLQDFLEFIKNIFR